MTTEANMSSLQDRVRELERELSRQKGRSRFEGVPYEAMLMRRELIIWGLAMAFLMCFLWKAI